MQNNVIENPAGTDSQVPAGRFVDYGKTVGGPQTENGPEQSVIIIGDHGSAAKAHMVHDAVLRKDEIHGVIAAVIDHVDFGHPVAVV